MKTLVISCLLFTVSVSALADLTDDVRCREIGFSKSVETGDAEKFAAYLDADARFVGNSVSSGSAAVIEAWSAFFAVDAPTIMWRPRFVEVLKDGKLALSRGPFRIVSKDEDGNDSEYWGTFNSVWRPDENGEWKVVFDAGSSEPETPSDEVRALLDQEDDCV